MKAALLFVAGLIAGAVLISLPKIVHHLHAALSAHRGGSADGSTRAHSEEKFWFIADAPMERVAPLFGADRERVWAPQWDPQFVHPLPAKDEEGMVFTVAHGRMKAAWVNTELDLANGRVSYVYVIPDALVTVIRLRLTPAGNQTRVDVEYDRTSLSADADEHLRHMAEGDRRSGPEWERQLNGYLRAAHRG